MAIIQDLHLFSWRNFQDDLQNLGDLERFKLVIETMPDGKLLQTLETLRGNGRNDHPIQTMWNSLLAGIVFDHPSIESLRRELRRNAQLREMCGFDPLKGLQGVPSKSAYHRFLCQLLKHEPLIRVVEAKVEMPVAYQVTQASIGEQPVMREMIKQLNQAHPDKV